MSSFASVLVAKAKATPENVVPCMIISARRWKTIRDIFLRNRFQQSIEPCFFLRLPPQPQAAQHQEDTAVACAEFQVEDQVAADARTHRHILVVEVVLIEVHRQRRRLSWCQWERGGEPSGFEEGA